MASGNPPTPPAPNAPAPNALQVLTQTITQSVLGELQVTLQDTLKTNRTNILDDVKSYLADTTTEITNKAAKKLKTENPTINNYGCRQQFEHNAEVLRTIEKAANAVLKGDSDACLKALSEGKRLIQHRQKLVRLADREEHGWRFVSEYEKDKLAEDSDDEKTIARARRTVNAKYPKPRGQRSNFRSQNRNPSHQSHSRSGSSSNYQNDRASSSSTNQYPRQSHQSNYQSQNSRIDFRRDRYDRECHICRERGHLSFNCPKKR